MAKFFLRFYYRTIGCERIQANQFLFYPIQVNFGFFKGEVLYSAFKFIVPLNQDGIYSGQNLIFFLFFKEFNSSIFQDSVRTSRLNALYFPWVTHQNLFFNNNLFYIFFCIEIL